MCTLNSNLFPNYGCLLSNTISQEWKELSQDIFHFPSSPLQPEIKLDESANGGVPTMVSKKLNHNAKERDRRRHINTLFTSLRSLIPAADQTTKLTNPAIVSLALEYIPDIQQQVKTLLKKKEAFSRIKNCRQADADADADDDDDDDDVSSRTKQSNSFEPATISMNQLNESEITIQISTYQNVPLSDILFDLEEDGFELINASSFESCQRMMFHSLHLKVERSGGLERQVLNKKLLSLYKQKQFGEH